MEWDVLILGVVTGFLIFTIALAIVDVPFNTQTGVAEMVCESHGLELDYFEGPLDKVVCEERPEDLSNKKVFEFNT